ncbi:MAG: endo alpha-1,4 polygalactosaminidase [Pseudomonadota bacterium]|nr:endo alpha-1,4 polygalactosaminidase [Pseudomonadota bacterium]
MWLIDAFCVYLGGLQAFSGALLGQRRSAVLGPDEDDWPAGAPLRLTARESAAAPAPRRQAQGVVADAAPSARGHAPQRAAQGLLAGLRHHPASKVGRLLPLCLVMSGCAVACDNRPSTAFFYGAAMPVAALAQFDRVVVEAENVKDLAGLRVAGADVFAYVSVGEAEGWRASASALAPELFVGTNLAWHSRIADLTQPGWRNYLIEQRMALLWQTGYRGFFLDTLDSYERVVNTPDQQLAQSRALVEIIHAVSQRFPGVKLLFNRGFAVLPEVGPLGVGLVAESLFQSWNPTTQQYAPVAENERSWLLHRLNDARLRYGLPITVIDYVPPEQPALVQETVRQIKALGFTPWVSTPGLDILGAGVEK